MKTSDTDKDYFSYSRGGVVLMLGVVFEAKPQACRGGCERLKPPFFWRSAPMELPQLGIWGQKSPEPFL
jgi:hypothetical protein